jgi:hypothetical protein
MGLYNYERIAERLLRKLESLDPNSNEYKLTLYAYKKTIDQQPTHKNRQNVEDYISLSRMSELAPIQGSDYQSMPSHGGPASGGDPAPAHFNLAEYDGEMAASHGGSPYKEAEKKSVGEKVIEAYKSANKYGEFSDFSSFMKDYVRRAEKDTAEADAAEAERRANSVKISSNSVVESSNPEFLERIRQQAGGTPGGGTFNYGVGSLKGGDTEEDLRAYADNYRNTEVDRQIGLIEQAFPAAYRPPALDKRLEDLYQARANRDQYLAETGRTEVLGRQAEAQMLESEADKLRAGNELEITRIQAQAQVDAARAYAGNRMPLEEKDIRDYAAKLATKIPKTPESVEIIQKIITIAYDSTMSPEDRKIAIDNELAKIGGGPSAGMTQQGPNITGYPDIDAAIAPRPRG